MLPKLTIIWDNVNLKGSQFKLELLRQEYLHISGIQIYGTAIKSFKESDEKDWMTIPNKKVILSSVYEDENTVTYGVDNLLDNNLQTYCRTNNTSNPFPYIMVKFEETIHINKIIIFNRHDSNHSRILPCKLSIMNDKDQVLMTATKNKFDKPLIFSKRIEEPPVGCL